MFKQGMVLRYTVVLTCHWTKLKRQKEDYKNKVERQLQNNKIRQVWKGVLNI